MSLALVVEDERNIRLLIAVVLKQQGYDIIEAGTGLEALLKLSQYGNVALIVSDIRMPELDGIHFAEVVKKNYPHIPIVIVSAYADLGAEALERGADAYLSKPFTRDQLLAAVRDVTQLKI
jgi:CheY-like chemotaxis protein